MLKNFAADLKREFAGYNAQRLGQDVMAGLTVTAVALPLALAFGVSSGASAAAGLVTAILAGVVMSLLSGASYQISGPTGAMSAILVTLVLRYGMQGMFAACFLAGALLLLAGILRLGRLVSFIPMPVVTGFTSGIAIIIALGQIDNFFGTHSEGGTAVEKLFSYGKLGFTPQWQAVLLGGIVVAVMLLWPKKWNARVPSSLVGIIVATAVSMVCGFTAPMVGDIPRTLLLEERLRLSALDFTTLGSLISPAFSIAMLGMIESLLCGVTASNMKKEEFNADRELLAQGVGNLLIPLFGGVPATAAIARTSVAIKSGGQTRLTGVFHAVGLLASMFLLGPVMAKLPLAALAGVLMVTAWRMNEWSNIRYIFSKKFKSAIAQFLITMLATVLFDLTVAIGLGVVTALVLFAAKASGMTVEVSQVQEDKLPQSHTGLAQHHTGTQVVYVTGALFFASVKVLTAHTQALCDADTVIFSLRGCPYLDISGAQALMRMCESLKAAGTRVCLCGVQDGVRTVMERAGLTDELGENAFYWSVDKALLDGVPV